MSYQNEEALPMLDGAKTSKKQSYGLAVFMVLCLAVTSFMAGHAYSSAATIVRFDIDLCDDILGEVVDACGEEIDQCVQGCFPCDHRELNECKAKPYEASFECALVLRDIEENCSKTTNIDIDDIDVCDDILGEVDDACGEEIDQCVQGCFPCHQRELDKCKPKPYEASFECGIVFRDIEENCPKK